MATFERTGPAQARAPAGWLRHRGLRLWRGRLRHGPRRRELRAHPSLDRGRPQAHGQRPRRHEPRPVEGRHRLLRRPLHAPSASSHRGRASSGARATTSSGASSTTSVAGSSPPSTTAPWRREKRSLWASRSFRGNHAVYLRAATVVDEARKVPAYDPLADGRFKGCPNGRRLWPFWLVRAATGNVRDGEGPTPLSRRGPLDRPRRRRRPGPSASPTTASIPVIPTADARPARRHRAARGHRRHRRRARGPHRCHEREPRGAAALPARGEARRTSEPADGVRP